MPAPGLEFINFILTLASDRDKLREYLDDPKAVATEAGLSQEQVKALLSGNQLKLNALVSTDLSEWVLTAFQGVPPPLIPPPGSKGAAGKKPSKK